MAKKETLPGIRLNKYISDSGFCSRREADKLITDERVTINGHLATLGSRVEEGDKVKIDGEPLHYIPMEQREYKLLRGFVAPQQLVRGRGCRGAVDPPSGAQSGCRGARERFARRASHPSCRSGCCSRVGPSQSTTGQTSGRACRQERCCRA